MGELPTKVMQSVMLREMRMAAEWGKFGKSKIGSWVEDHNL
jgi:hypothetical protein